MSMRRHSKLRWAFLLAGAILALGAVGGPLEFHHHATAKDYYTCTIHHWMHGAGATEPTCIHLTALLPIVGAATPDLPGLAPDVAHHPTPSRAPPSIA